MNYENAVTMKDIEEIKKELDKYKELIDIDFKTVYQLMANHSKRLDNQQNQIQNLTKMLDIVKDIAENKTGKKSNRCVERESK